MENETPYVVTAITGGVVALFAGFLPVGQLVDYANAGTLYAFAMVAAALLILRRKDPDRPRSFRTPAAWIIAPLTIAGCTYLYLSLPLSSILVLPAWGIIGLVIYFGYGHRHSHLGKGIVEVPDFDDGDLEPGKTGAD